MTASSISETNKPIKPCKNCGSLNKNNDGSCKQCKNLHTKLKRESNREKSNLDSRNNAKAKAERRRLSKEECKKCGGSDWNNQGMCRTCAAIKRKIKYDATAEKSKAGARRWHHENREKALLRSKKYKQDNPAKFRVYEHNRNAKIKENGGILSVDIISKLLVLQKGKCACCRLPLGDDYHLDHIMPVKLGGKNEDSNIQLLTSVCNMRKSAKDPIDFMQELGFLL